jgi:phospholipase/lecithinase/hemolysin
MINHHTLGQPASLAFGALPDDVLTAGHFTNIGAAQDFVPPQAAAASYNLIYAFGDSLTDAGNDYIASDGLLPTSAVYADGRFSNGNVWVQDLAQDLKLPAVKPSLAGGTDYAYGGAETGQDPLHTENPIDLPSQLLQFEFNVFDPSPDALYALSIGANDTIDAIPEYAKSPTLALKDVSTAVSNEVGFVKDLAADGARNFVILNVPDLGKTPEESGAAATATKLSAYYDSLLGTDLAALAAHESLDIHIVNTFGLIDAAVADPSKYGLTNVTTPVWTGNFEDPSSGTLNATGSAQNKYLFFDHLHPTETGHEAIASLAYGLLK